METRFQLTVAMALFGLVHAMSKDRAMFLDHSDACFDQSKADPALVANMFNGVITDDPGLKRHVLCMLQKCKMISKDGKLQKGALNGPTPIHVNDTAASKIMKSCSEPQGDTPEEIAWNFFRCAFDKKDSLWVEVNHGTNKTVVKRETHGISNIHEGTAIVSYIATGSTTTRDTHNYHAEKDSSNIHGATPKASYMTPEDNSTKDMPNNHAEKDTSNTHGATAKTSYMTPEVTTTKDTPNNHAEKDTSNMHEATAKASYITTEATTTKNTHNYHAEKDIRIGEPNGNVKPIDVRLKM